MSRLALYLLGSFHVTLDDQLISDFESQRAEALLAYLAIESDRPHSREALAGLLWPDYPEPAARRNLTQSLVRLRHAIGDPPAQGTIPPVLLITPQTVQFNRARDTGLDVTALTELLSTNETHLHRHAVTCRTCHQRLRQAVELYRGDFLQGFFLKDSDTFEEWMLVKRDQLRLRALDALERLAAYHERRAEYDLAQRYAGRQVELAPWHEPAHRRLMRILALRGQRGASLVQYETCRRILSQELGVEPEAETTLLYEQIRSGKWKWEDGKLPTPNFASPTPQSGARAARVGDILPTSNLPPQVTSFIGRETELAQLSERLLDPTCRLVTLVGEGGIGKTRLALAAAEQVRDDFVQGAWFMPLVAVNGYGSEKERFTGEATSGDTQSALHNVLSTAIASALNVVFHGQAEAKSQLFNYLRDKELLLVLDNFEHLQEGADFILDLLRYAPRLSVLVASRERLHFQAEYVMQVQPLPVPRAGSHGMDYGSIFDYSSVRLFAARAERASSRFLLDERNVHTVSRICQLVGGLPLGLELAAAWTSVSSCEHIADEIERSLDFLSTTMRDLPERHRSMRAVFEHSWRLLSRDEQRVFRMLSVFRGSFSRDAAEQVAGATPHLLIALVEKSLVRRTSADRYEIHELLRQYAAEQLQAIPGENEQVQDLHCNYYAAFLQQRTGDVKGQRRKEAMEEIAGDMDNIRLSWCRAVARRNLAAIRQSMESLWLYWETRGGFQEAETAFRQAVTELSELIVVGHQPESKCETEEQNLVLGLLLALQGWFSSIYGPAERGQALQQGVSLLRQAGQEAWRELARSLFFLGMIQYYQAQYDEASHHFQESLTLCRQAGDRWGAACGVFGLGSVAKAQGALLKAERLYQESVTLCTESGVQLLKAQSLSDLGHVSQALGKFLEAQQRLTESLQIGLEHGDVEAVTTALYGLGELARVRGQYPQAKEYLEQSLALSKKYGDHVYINLALCGLGALTRLQGEQRQAADWLQESLARMRASKFQWSLALCLNQLGCLVQDQGAYREAERFYQESLTISQQLGAQHDMASSLRYLGHLACAMGSARRAEARPYFQQALEIAVRIHAVPLVLDVLAGMATLFSMGQPDEKYRAVELLAFILNHPASEHETKLKAQHLLAQLTTELPPQVVALAQERGKASESDSLAAAILHQAK